MDITTRKRAIIVALKE